MKRNLVRSGLTLFAMALLMIAGAGSAAAATQSSRELTPISIFVPCANGGAGELVEGIVRRHVVTGITEDGAGGFHVHTSLQDRGALLGTVTGDT
ncbi:MAG TPA: hypothetical protein VEP28_06865, partial [Rubrobacter sp.]|nr:hypothetical protein [Rubrobacter sp.]